MHYSAFNLSWESKALLLPELPVISEADSVSPDVRIEPQSSQQWPDMLPGPHDTPFVQMGPGDLRLTVEGIGRFRIHDGHHIAWERWSDAVSDADLRAFLLGSAVGAALIQRGLLVLHGNALVKDGQGIACLGHSGAGKSTLAYALMSQGWQLLADDLVAVTPDGMVLPGIPRIKLWEDAVEAFGLEPGELVPVREGMHKYTLMGNQVQRAPAPVPLRALYRIHQDRHASEQPTPDQAITPIPSQKEAALVLRNQAYRPRFVRGLGREGANFLVLARLQQQVPLADLSLPPSIAAMQTFLERFDLLSAASPRPEPEPVGGAV